MALYPISASARAELVRYGENTTYRVIDGETSLALRLARPGYQSRAGIESELAWMSSLREYGIDTPPAVRGLDGELVQELTLSDGGAQLAVAFDWVEGVPLPQAHGLDPWKRLGEIMAEVHEHARNWSPPPGFTRPAWDLDALVGDSPRWGTPVPDGVWGESDGRAILSARGAIRERLAKLGTAPDRFGLIHSDLGFENVLVQPDGNTVVIDFDDCGRSWYLYELASVLYPLEGTPAFGARRDMLAEGYRAIRPLLDEELAELPTFLMCRRLATLGWTFSRSDTQHAGRHRERRLATSPEASRRFLDWHAVHPVVG
jgi:Ser/Thr protein kinase RdoA (MazF antagonist)